MENEEFERSLAECKAEMERLSNEIKALSERTCRLLEEHDGESQDFYWGCRSMHENLDDVLEDITRRLERYRDGDRKELPTVMMLAIECCERLQETAEMCRTGRQNERRDLKGQIESNLGYLAHHLAAMEEDSVLPEDRPEFPELKALAAKVVAGNGELEESIEFICTQLDPVHQYLEKVRREMYWEESEE